MSGKSTRRALLTSALAILACAAMLVSTTFAWFTDTASTAVNTITSGNLHVEIQGEDNKPVSQLNWVAKDGRAQDEILWEPGCTYTLTPFKIVNTGNLALKYKIVITGLDGDSALLDVIRFTYTTEDGTFDMDAEGHLAANGKDGFETKFITVSATMDTAAGNEYQNKTLTGVKFTVYATQDTVEYDSIDNQYDKNAKYTEIIAGGKTFTGKQTISTGITATNPNAIAVKVIGPAADLTIEDGTFDGGAGGSNVCVAAANGATVTIKGGTFTVGGDKDGYGNSVVYSVGGNIVIEGGFFYTNYSWKGKYYVLNMNNGNPGKITVKGGTFVNYDPSDSASENPHGNFVAEGYSVISETKANGDVWYTVVKGTGVVPGTQDDLNKGITDSATKDVTVVLPENSSFTLDNDIANEGAKARDITFVGDGTQTVDVVKNATSAEGGMLSYQRGSTFTFENLTVQAGEGTYDGIVADALTYKNCTIKGKLTLYGKATFVDCTFENDMANQYSIWTWGGTDVTFENCTFNTNGKAILLFGEEKTTNLTVSKCTFNDRKNGVAGKAAIEIGEANYGKHNNFTVVVDGAVVNGHATGKNTDTNLWANKNSMDKDHLSVTVDGKKVY